MQHSKLKVGTEYLISYTRDWRTARHYSQFRGRLVSRERLSLDRRGEPVSDPSGNRVEMVEVIETLNGETVDGETRYAKLHDIRGVWAEAAAEQEDNIEAGTRAVETLQKRLAAADKAAHNLAELATKIGLDVTPQRNFDPSAPDRWEFVITPEALIAFVNRALGENN